MKKDKETEEYYHLPPIVDNSHKKNPKTQGTNSTTTASNPIDVNSKSKTELSFLPESQKQLFEKALVDTVKFISRPGKSRSVAGPYSKPSGSGDMKSFRTSMKKAS